MQSAAKAYETATDSNVNKYVDNKHRLKMSRKPSNTPVFLKLRRFNKTVFDILKKIPGLERFAMKI